MIQIKNEIEIAIERAMGKSVEIWIEKQIDEDRYL